MSVKSLYEVGQEAVDVYSGHRTATDRIAELQAEKVRSPFDQNVASVAERNAKVMPRTAELRSRQSSFDNPLTPDERRELELLESDILAQTLCLGEVAIRRHLDRQSAEQGIVDNDTEGTRHFQDNVGALYELAALEAHIAGVPLNLQQPIEVGTPARHQRVQE